MYSIKRRGKHEVEWRCHGNAKGNGPSPKKTTLDTFCAKCFSLFDYSSVEEAIHVLKLMLAKNCYGIFRFGPSARGLIDLNPGFPLLHFVAAFLRQDPPLI